MAPSILILNGPNLNLLGGREPGIYGTTTLAEIKAACVARGEQLGVTVDFRQSNAEGELLDWIHRAQGVNAALIINAGAYSHTSLALLDALMAVALPVYEVHLSNIFRRESFRHRSYVSQVAKGVISGLGPLGYELALEAAVRDLALAGWVRSDDQVVC